MWLCCCYSVPSFWHDKTSIKNKKGPYDQTETCYSESTESIIIDYIWLKYTETKTCKITFVELHNLMHIIFLCSTVICQKSKLKWEPKKKQNPPPATCWVITIQQKVATKKVINNLIKRSINYRDNYIKLWYCDRNWPSMKRHHHKK